MEITISYNHLFHDSCVYRLVKPIVQKGKLAACAAWEPTNALNRVLFPTLGNPTIPQFNFMDRLS